MPATADDRAAATVQLNVDRRLLIDGRLVDTDRKVVSINPATTQVIGHAPDADVPEALFAKVRYGDPADRKTYMGPLISERQREKVDAMVQRAVEGGAILVTGGERVDPGFFYTPTLLTNVDPESEIAQQEVFGPVLAVTAFDDDEDAVRIANNSIYGLAGAVFSAEQDRAVAVARRIKAGSFAINGGNYFLPDSPFGGFKQSGVGREMGVAGLEEFLERKTFAAVVE